IPCVVFLAFTRKEKFNTLIYSKSYPLATHATKLKGFFNPFNPLRFIRKFPYFIRNREKVLRSAEAYQPKKVLSERETK
ncbi:hypothetical protein CQA37_09910, partial [Helicobacter sp. MIT 99-10781]